VSELCAGSLSLTLEHAGLLEGAGDCSCPIEQGIPPLFEPGWDCTASLSRFAFVDSCDSGTDSPGNLAVLRFYWTDSAEEAGILWDTMITFPSSDAIELVDSPKLSGESASGQTVQVAMPYLRLRRE